MAEHLRAFVVVIFIAFIIFYFIRKALEGCVEGVVFSQWRNTWFALTCAAFVSHSYWLFAALTALIVLTALQKTPNPVSLFFACLFAVPAAEIQIPGFGLVNYLFTINYPRLLELFVLLPVYVNLRSRPDTLRFGTFLPDRLIITLSLLMMILQFRETTFTDALRNVVYIIIDVVLPYYVISRSVRSLENFRTTISAFIVSASLLAGFAVFEFTRHWNLYSAMVQSLDPKMGFGAYLGRDGLLRAYASTGHSIALGLIMAVAIGLFLFLRSSIRRNIFRRLGWLVLFTGLIAPLSRGPWVGAVIILIAHTVTGASATKKLFFIGIFCIFFVPLLSTLPGGEKIINLLPFVGTVDKNNIDYREQLVEKSWIVIQRNPLLGSVDYLETPEMESMRQGQGIIDIVNTYIGIALEYGLIGLTLFAGFFLTILYGVFKAQQSIKTLDHELHQLGRALFATLAGILFIIFTVSSITIIPIVYWSIAGLCMAYIQVVRMKLIKTRSLSPT